MTEELKPCPFCGGEAEGPVDATRILGFWRVYHRCRIGALEAKGETEAEAIAAGNRRAPDAALIEAGDRLAGFAGHDDGCALGLHGPACSCGYTEAVKAWKEVRGE